MGGAFNLVFPFLKGSWVSEEGVSIAVVFFHPHGSIVEVDCPSSFVFYHVWGDMEVWWEEKGGSFTSKASNTEYDWVEEGGVDCKGA